MRALLCAQTRLEDAGIGFKVRHPTVRLAWMFDLFGIRGLLEDDQPAQRRGRQPYRDSTCDERLTKLVR